MKTVIIFIVVLFNVGFAQQEYSKDTTDVVEEIKKLFNTNNINLYGGTLDMAVINKKKELNIIMRENPGEYYNNTYIGNKPQEEITLLAGFSPFFKSAKIILEKFPDIVKYTIFTIEIYSRLDKYGNFQNYESSIVKTISMKKSTIKKINWDYVDRTLFKAISNADIKKINIITNMCDLFSMKKVRIY